jgi:acetyl esterase/lipase
MPLARFVLSALAGALVIPSALLAWGTFSTSIPYLGTIGTSVFPTFAGPFAVLGLAGAALAMAARSHGARRTGPALTALGVLTAAAGATIIVRHATVAAAHGARVNVIAAVVPRSLSAGASADDTVTYTDVDGETLQIDVYRPGTDAGRPAPVVIYIHGGGWIENDRTTQAASLRWFAERGFLAVSMDYVLATPERATWRSAGEQVACAMTWTANNAAGLGGDPDRMFAFGESAGGALALSASYAVASGEASSSCGGMVPTVRAVAAQLPAVDPVTFYENKNPLTAAAARSMVRQYLGGSPAEYPERVRAVSPITYVTPNAPPTLILLADNDHLVPIEGALQFIERAERAGVTIHVVRFPWADHGVSLQFYSVANQAMLQLMLQHFCRNGGRCAP